MCTYIPLDHLDSSNNLRRYELIQYLACLVHFLFLIFAKSHGFKKKIIEYKTHLHFPAFNLAENCTKEHGYWIKCGLLVDLLNGFSSVKKNILVPVQQMCLRISLMSSHQETE